MHRERNRAEEACTVVFPLPSDTPSPIELLGTPPHRLHKIDLPRLAWDCAHLDHLVISADHCHSETTSRRPTQAVS